MKNPICRACFAMCGERVECSTSFKTFEKKRCKILKAFMRITNDNVPTPEVALTKILEVRDQIREDMENNRIL